MIEAASRLTLRCNGRNGDIGLAPKGYLPPLSFTVNNLLENRSHSNSHTKIGTSTRFVEAQLSSASGMTIWSDAHLITCDRKLDIQHFWYSSIGFAISIILVRF
ncbi:MAG: hypothetical protein HC903_03120 [Methylacidiphilales bacterium]|nr:hypothetical protein [Candidatus Methylacidiphilales bacterium]NJR14516.1 hypothetical protein [Calothrix sp. CSU_2_0]